ncbi:MAG: hypothetical protein J6328_03915 [Bacilli bacterium]|nr:hypothetical protein [Bacilli bacterium]
MGRSKSKLSFFVLLGLSLSLASCGDEVVASFSKSTEPVSSLTSSSISSVEPTPSSSNSSKQVDPKDDDYVLKDDHKTCSNHEDFVETIVRKATIIRKGIKGFTCPSCGGYHEEYYYDLDEVA